MQLKIQKRIKLSVRQKQTKAIILNRINYAEADRILTIFTKDYGKIKVIAKGVRKERSKLAGSIELFCISDICYVEGRGEIGILTSAMLSDHYENIIKDIEKLDFAYSCIKLFNRITEDKVDKDYYLLLCKLFDALDDINIPITIIKIWWFTRVSKLTGHDINTRNTIDDKKFHEDDQYVFVIENGGFLNKASGNFCANHIKLIKIARSHEPDILIKIRGAQQLASEILPSLNSFIDYQL